MIPSTELQRLGEYISKRFIEDKVALNQSLEKVASEHMLNSDQTARVAEAANVETYLTLLKANDGGYISFPLADAAEIKTASFLEGLDDASFDYTPEYLEFEELAKVAEVVDSLEYPRSQAEANASRWELVSNLEHASAEVGMIATDISTGINKLAYLVEQYKRGLGTSPTDLASVIKEASGDTYEVFQEMLLLPPVSAGKKVDQTTELYKLAETIAEKIQDGTEYYHYAARLESEALESEDKMIKRAGVLSGTGQILDSVIGGTGRAIGDSLKYWWKKSPDSVLAGGAAVGAYGMGKTVGSNRKGQVLQNSALSLQKPNKVYRHGY
jgi:hypothetical protein